MIDAKWKVLICQEKGLLLPKEVTQEVLDEHVELLLRATPIKETATRVQQYRHNAQTNQVFGRVQM